ncbi:MAG: GtrA family protein [Actinomycetes bacterium]
MTWLRSAAAQLDVRLQHLVAEILKFGTVGMLSLVVDVGLFNALRYSGGEGVLYAKPLTAKAISMSVATVVAYLGNRHWTYRHRERTGTTRELVLFFALNGVALLIALACLWASHYGLGLRSPLADNISANVVGLGLGTLFRFATYRRWVFPTVTPSAPARVTAGVGGPPR